MRAKIAISRLAVTAKLERLDPRWTALNEGFENLTVTYPDVMTQLSGGHSICGWMSGIRSYANFMGVQHIGVDMDTEDSRSTIAALSAHPLVQAYGGLIYTTFSHTQHAPRARVVFYLNEFITNPDAAKSIMRFITAQFDGADEAVAEPTRFFYGNPQGEFEYIGRTLDLDIVRVLYQRAQRLAAPKKNAQTSTRQDSKLPNNIIKMPLRLTGDKESEYQRTITALRSFSPWSIDYNTWIGLIAAMKREFGDRAKAEVIEWAQGKPGEVEREWDRNTKTNRPGAVMQINTVFFLSERFGSNARKAAGD